LLAKYETMEDKLFFICDCHSFEHQLIFWWCEEDKVLYVHTHLITYRGFFKRLWVALKYAFRYKSRFGAWDELIFTEESLKKLQEFLNSKIN